jgi:hypothetical protein
MLHTRSLSLLCIAALTLTACAGSAKKHAGPPPVKTRTVAEFRGPPESQHWSANNSEFVVKQLAAAFVGSPGVKALREKLGRAPLLRLMPVRNRTPEHLQTKMIMQLFEQRVGEKGLFATTASNADKADLIVNGFILSHNDNHGRHELRVTYLSMEAIRKTTSEKIWVGVAPVRKLVVFAPTPPRKAGTPAGAKPIVPDPKVTRLALDAGPSLSGGLNDRDLRRIAQTAVKAAIANWLSKAPKPLVVKFQPLQDSSQPKIKLALLTKELQARLLKSGKIRLVPGHHFGGPADAKAPKIKAELEGALSATVSAKQGRYEFTLKAKEPTSKKVIWSFSMVVDKKVPPPAKDKGLRPTSRW